MLAPRWRKVLADLWNSKARTVLSVLSIAVGVLTVGMISTSYVIMGRDMDASYREIDPSGGIMFTSPFGPEFLTTLRRVPGVGKVEGRARFTGYKVQAGDSPLRDLNIWAIPDYNKVELDRLILVSGHWPGRREVLLEANSLPKLPVEIGETVQVQLADGRQRVLQVAGVVQDRTSDSTSMAVLGYVTLDSVEYLGEMRALNYLEFTAAENAGDREHVRAVGREIETQFSRNGAMVGTTIILEPGRHPAAQQSASVMALLAAMAVLTVLLSGFLVINTVSALMAQQIRYIGVMKAVGARTRQVIGMYLALLLCLGLLALLIAAPLGLLGGYRATQMIAKVLNFTIRPFQIEPVPLAIMAILSLAVPLLAGLVPVRNGAVTTIRAAISGYGLNGAYGRGLIDRFFAHLHGLSRPLLISLRNTVRRKARLTLTLATLVLAGAIFMGVLGAQVSMSASLTQMYHYYLADVNVDFDRAYRVNSIAALLGSLPGVQGVEGWIFASAELRPDGALPGANQVATDRLTLMAPPADSALVERAVLAGRWLLPDDQNALVVCTTAMSAHPDWHVGSVIHLKLNGKADSDFTIVGTFPFASGEGNKIAMANYAYLADLLNARGQAGSYRIVTSAHDNATQDSVRNAAVAQFKALGYKATVTSLHSQADSLGLILNTIVEFLLGLAALIAIVGGLGLAGMMSMNVMERTREIGVMRSIGATNGAVAQLVIVEGVLTGLLSWIGGALLGVPVGKLLAAVLGQGLFGTPFAFVLAWNSLLIWLAIVVVLSIIASALPAMNASRLTVREVLAYE